MNETESFLADVHKDDTKVDLLEEKLEMPTEAGIPEKVEPQEPRNRQERRAATRRWERELAERERDIIAREARAATISELQSKAAPSEVPMEWLQMFGDKPETRQAWALQEKLDAQRFEKIRDELRNEMVEEENERRLEERQADEELEDIFDEIEETYNVDLSSNAPATRKARNQFLDALSAVSHKNESGEVDVYGDANAAYELWQLKRAKESPTQQRQKDLASRGMTPTAEVNISKTEDDAVRAYLRSEGIKV